MSNRGTKANWSIRAMFIIRVENLCKEFRQWKGREGLVGAIKELFTSSVWGSEIKYCWGFKSDQHFRYIQIIR